MKSTNLYGKVNEIVDGDSTNIKKEKYQRDSFGLVMKRFLRLIGHRNTAHLRFSAIFL